MSPLAGGVGSRFSAQLIAWQAEHGRHALPWQQTTDPYRVWLSEIMLQQTQVATVLGYYARFLARFPDVQALAAAPLDDVLALWSGLGYYSRARNLHACARAVLELHGGAFPRSSAALQTLPGIGRSTSAAIAAFCFGERVAILDGNVKRVLTRFLGFDGDLAVASQERTLWGHATALLPHAQIEPYTQGLMDLGATLCTMRSPQCGRCPVQAGCEAHAQGTPERFPIKTRKLKRSTRSHVWLWLCWGERLWLMQRPESGVWASLWSWPEFDDAAAFQAASAAWPGQGEALAGFKHVLTHLDWHLSPVRWVLPQTASAQQVAAVTQTLPAGRWVSEPEALAMGLPAPLRKLLRAGVARAT